MIGQYDQAVEESSVAIRLDPNSAARQATFINSLVHLNRFAEALSRLRARPRLEIGRYFDSPERVSDGFHES